MVRQWRLGWRGRPFGNTPLLLAIEKGATLVVRLLVARQDLCPNHRNKRDDTALSLACARLSFFRTALLFTMAIFLLQPFSLARRWVASGPFFLPMMEGRERLRGRRRSGKEQQMQMQRPQSHEQVQRHAGHGGDKTRTWAVDEGRRRKIGGQLGTAKGGK